MCAKAFTTPVSNVVTRKQTASLLKNNGNNNNNNTSTFRQIVSSIYREKGLPGLWAGYSASLVLTLNPSLTFFLQQQLKRAFVPRREWDDPAAGTTFFLAAVSKSFATSVTYPFQIAKARVQVCALPGDDTQTEKKKKKEGKRGWISSLAGDSIFATVVRIQRAEGGRALYDGIGGELIKAFFNHGITMLVKDVLHRVLVRGYFAVVLLVRGWPVLRARLWEGMRRGDGGVFVLGVWRRVIARVLGWEGVGKRSIKGGL